MDRPEIRENIGQVRADEVAASARIIGYDELVMLGYRDSGMPDSEANNDPRCFAKADFDEAVGRFVEVLRRERPQVIITYGDEQAGYPHPDHLRVHDISLPAFERAGDPEWYPEAGEPWQPLKLYYTIWARARMEAVHNKMLELGLESPYDAKWFDRPWNDDRITTRVDVSQWLSVRRDALLAHATQIDPTSPFWFGLSDDVLAELYPWEDWVLARSLVGTPPEGELESDLFAGIRTEARGGATSSRGTLA
jgi:mycothiol S-conjugate amidase